MRHTHRQREWLTEDITQIQRYFPGATVVKIFDTPFDIAPSGTGLEMAETDLLCGATNRLSDTEGEVTLPYLRYSRDHRAPIYGRRTAALFPFLPHIS